jgi:hypothetical protein
MKRVTATLIVLVALLGWPARWARVSAECITDGETPRKRLSQYPLVFVGDVLNFEKSSRPESTNYRVRFRVIETFRGIDAGERVLEFTSTAESFSFATSNRVLVYASLETRDTYSTQCTATRVVASEDREVQELRRLSRRSDAARRSR